MEIENWTKNRQIMVKKVDESKRIRPREQSWGQQVVIYSFREIIQFYLSIKRSELTIWVSYSLFKGLKHIWLGVEKNSRDIKGFSCCINYFFSRWILEKSQGKARGRAIDKLVLFLQKNKLHRDKRKCFNHKEKRIFYK